MAAPTYVQASTGTTDATGAFTFTGVASGTIGDVCVLHIVIDGTGAISWGTLGGANIQDLAGTASTWTLVGTFNIGSPTTAQQRVYMGRRTSAGSAPTFTASANTSGDDVYGRMYEFTNVSTGTTLATVIENSSAGSTNTTVGLSGTPPIPYVTTLGDDRLALIFYGGNDDVTPDNFSSSTEFNLVTAAYAEAGGTDAVLACYSCPAPVAASYSSVPGDTIGAGGAVSWGMVSFALIGTTAPPSSIVLQTGFVNFNDPGVL